MQQRVGLARALAVDPDILLMDEPFSGLDPLIRTQMQDELLRLQEELHKTIVFITHDLTEALKLGDRIVIMRDGRVIQNSTPKDIVLHPSDNYVAEFTRNVQAAEVLTAGIVATQPRQTLSADLSIEHALKDMEVQNNVVAFVIDSDGKYLGSVERDTIINASGNVKEFLSKNIHSVGEHTSFKSILPEMIGHQNPIAVVDDTGVLIGEILPETVAKQLRDELV
jgi:glycine betaine/proline transport system ATP-binding protein